MPKKLLATTIVLYLAIPMLSSISMVNANFSPAGLFIQSAGGLIYSGENSTSIPLWIEVIVPTGASPIIAISYSVDAGANITLSRLFYTTYYPSNSPYNMDVYYNRNEKLDNLTDGKHTVRAYSIDNSGNKLMSDLAVFTVQKNGKTGIFLNGFPNGYPQPNTSITPIIPHPTMTQTPSIIPTATLSSDYWQNSTFFAALAVVIAIVAVASVSLVYFRRRRGKA
jgi:hypothetical protein